MLSSGISMRLRRLHEELADTARLGFATTDDEAKVLATLVAILANAIAQKRGWKRICQDQLLQNMEALAEVQVLLLAEVARHLPQREYP